MLQPHRPTSFETAFWFDAHAPVLQWPRSRDPKVLSYQAGVEDLFDGLLRMPLWNHYRALLLTWERGRLGDMTMATQCAYGEREQQSLATCARHINGFMQLVIKNRAVQRANFDKQGMPEPMALLATLNGLWSVCMRVGDNKIAAHPALLGAFVDTTGAALNLTFKADGACFGRDTRFFCREILPTLYTVTHSLVETAARQPGFGDANQNTLRSMKNLLCWIEGGFNPPPAPQSPAAG